MARQCLDHIYTETETFALFSDYTWHSIPEPVVESAKMRVAAVAGCHRIAKRIEGNPAVHCSGHPSHPACLADGDDGAVFLQALIRYSVPCFAVVSAEGLEMAFAEIAVVAGASGPERFDLVISVLSVLRNSVDPAEN